MFIANFPVYMIHYMSCILLTIIRERITGIYRLIHFIPRLLCMNVYADMEIKINSIIGACVR